MTRDQPETWSRSRLAYCSNVHPAGSLAQLSGVVRDQISGVRRLRGLDTMGSGLWLEAGVARELVSSSHALNEFTTLLTESGLELFTLNGFPYGNFHQGSVKQKVYQPDWADPTRFDYTLNLARILAHCLPSDCSEGSISTLPLGYAPDWNRQRNDQALNALCRMALALSKLRQRSDRHIRICLEMEPGCVLESTDQAIQLFSRRLPEAGRRCGVSESILADHLGVCYDICHQAVMFEHPRESLSRISDADIRVGKIQVSSALELPAPSITDLKPLLQPFSEPIYLHQVRTLDHRSQVCGAEDIPQALTGKHLPRINPWRIHFHVPIQARSMEHERLGTTQTEIEEVLDYLQSHSIRPHLEVETYTWQVLPRFLRPDSDVQLQQGIARELDWLEGAMGRRGMLEETNR
ncbi:MAG: metabolite traffic protein EboE [Gammaproteobacteria bacterium]|nr:metabolite traffic protein EboE [Gammaproteobacteria bacterium]